MLLGSVDMGLPLFPTDEVPGSMPLLIGCLEVVCGFFPPSFVCL